MTSWIDSHLHVWDPACLEYGWLSDEPVLNRRYDPSDLDAGATTLAGVVVIEAGRRSDQSGAEIEWFEQLAARWPVIVAMVAHVPLELGRDARPRVAMLANHPLVTGVRRNVQDESAGFAVTDDFIAGVRLLAEFGYTFDLCVRRWQLAEVIELVSRVPEVTFVLDHLGKPAVADQAPDAWRDDISRLAARPNVACKLSGLSTEADPRGWREEDVSPYLRHALGEFGAQRCMFGSDWPVATLTTSYDRWLNLVAGALDALSAAERDAVAAETARRIYRLPTVS